MIKPVKIITMDKIINLNLKHLFYCLIFIFILSSIIYRLGYNYIAYKIERTFVDVEDTSSTELY